MTIKSQIREYSVEFRNSQEFFYENVKDGDIVLVDSNVSFPILTKNLVIPICAKEEEKEYLAVYNIINVLVNIDLKKNNRIFIIGGGIAQDIGSFIASILYRGVEWFFIPTTLLAMSDGCIGSKTSINIRKYKNQIGTYWPPNKVCIDVGYTNSLSKDQINSAFGEILHYCCCDSFDSVKKFKELKDNKDYLELIKLSLGIKKKVIEIDEFEEFGGRKLFNFGHSFGHSVESVSDYQIPHGIAVAFGINIACYISDVLAFCFNEEQLTFIREQVKDITVDYSIKDLNSSDIVEAMKKDKKNTSSINVILISECGRLFPFAFKDPNHLYNLISNFQNKYA